MQGLSLAGKLVYIVKYTFAGDSTTKVIRFFKDNFKFMKKEKLLVCGEELKRWRQKDKDSGAIKQRFGD